MSALYFVHRIAREHAAGDAAVRKALLDAVVYVVPNLNVDGYLYTWKKERSWRKNRRDNGDGSFGVDLNRNWGPEDKWCKVGSYGTGTNSRSNQYCGKAVFSEPEVEAGRQFFAKHPGLRATVDLHAWGPSVLWPFFYKKDALPEPDRDVIERLGETVGREVSAVHGVDYKASSGADGLWYQHSGSMTDFAWEAYGAASFTFEARGPTMAPPASSIILAAEEQYAGLLAIAKEVLTSPGTAAALAQASPALRAARRHSS